MKYLITKPAFGTVAEIAITESDFSELKKARDKLNTGLAIEEKYEVVLGNYEDFEKEIVDSSIEWMLKHPRKYDDIRFYISKLNKRLINLLTAARLYFDHIEQHVSEIVPELSHGKDKVKELCADRYDKNLEYRFMEALRNYVQHCGFPVHHISLQSWATAIKDPERRLLYTIDLASIKEKLLEDKKFKRSVVKELDEKIDLKHTTRKYVECLSEIHKHVREIVSGNLIAARNLIEGYMNRFKEEFDEDILGISATSFDLEGRKVDEVPLLLEWDDIRIDLFEKNRVLTKLSLRYVTGESKIA